MKDKPDGEFWKMADSFINIANDHAETIPTGKVSSALMYAAARFNTHALALVTPDLEAVKSEALEYLIEQYRKMCIENIAEHTAEYRRQKRGRDE